MYSAATVRKPESDSGRPFHIDAVSVVVQALQALADAGDFPVEKVAEAAQRYRIDDPTATKDIKQEGGDA